MRALIIRLTGDRVVGFEYDGSEAQLLNDLNPGGTFYYKDDKTGLLKIFNTNHIVSAELQPEKK